jgi:hypothetical protein
VSAETTAGICITHLGTYTKPLFDIFQKTVIETRNYVNLKSGQVIYVQNEL